MNQTFSYKARYSWGFLSYGAVGIAAVAGSLGWDFITSFVALPFPWMRHVILVVGILAIAYAIHRLLATRAINSSSEPIMTDDAQVTFNNLSWYTLKKTSFRYDDVKKIWEKQDEDDGESIILYVGKNDRYEFFAENFENENAFNAFKEILSTKCTKLEDEE